jgi:hypothetical protein
MFGWLMQVLFMIFVTGSNPTFCILCGSIPVAAKLSLLISCWSGVLLITIITAVVIASIVVVIITCCLVLVFLFFITILFL